MYGTHYEERGGQLVRIVDRTGTCHAELTWNGDRLVRLAVDGVAVDGGVRRDPVLGDVHAVGATVMTAIDWSRPIEIPAIAAPGQLPSGAGAAILNAIAVLARRAEIPVLRYAGPYPTPVLWRSVARSFRCSADEAVFTADALDRAARLARDPIPVDFAPAPHERLAISGGFVELRDGVERAVLAGVSHEPGGSPARLVRDPDASSRAEIWFGDAPYAHIATLAADGTLLAGPYPVPPCTSPVVGREFPAALCGALAELVAEAVAAPLAADAHRLCAEGPLVWADLGPRTAQALPDGFAVHAALWDRIAPLGLGRLALALAEALAPVVAAEIARRAA